MSKRLVICADGTWNRPDRRDREVRRRGSRGEWIRKPSNVVKMTRAVKPQTSDGTQQVVFYDPGVGTGWGILDPIVGGAFGHGLSQNIKECYRFLVHNYDEGDELFLFGFSRGAFTVRSLAGLIGRCGLLTKDDAYYIPEAYQHYRLKIYREVDTEPGIDIQSGIPTWIPERIQEWIISRRKVESEKNKAKLDAFKRGEYGNRHQPTRPAGIKFIGVWDTVGALGIPLGNLFYWVNQRYRFHNVELGEKVDHAYQALAIDERRGAFTPTLWSPKCHPDQEIEQMWFAGVHSNVGGGCDPDYLADFAFEWMLQKLAGTGLQVDPEYTKYFERLGHFCKHPEEFAKLELRKSLKGIYLLLPRHPRCIGKDQAVHWTAYAFRDNNPGYRPENLP